MVLVSSLTAIKYGFASTTSVLDTVSLLPRELGPDNLAPFDRDGDLLLNVNTPEDYARARSIAAAPENSHRVDPQPPTG